MSFELINFRFNFFDLHPDTLLKRLLIYVTARFLKFISLFFHPYFNSFFCIKFVFLCIMTNILRDSHTAKFWTAHWTEMSGLRSFLGQRCLCAGQRLPSSRRAGAPPARTRPGCRCRLATDRCERAHPRCDIPGSRCRASAQRGGYPGQGYGP